MNREQMIEQAAFQARDWDTVRRIQDEQAHTPTDDEREALAGVIEPYFDRAVDYNDGTRDDEGLADAILGAGFRRTVQGEPTEPQVIYEHGAPEHYCMACDHYHNPAEGCALADRQPRGYRIDKGRYSANSPIEPSDPVRVIYVAPELIEQAQEALGAAGYASVIYTEVARPEQGDSTDVAWTEPRYTPPPARGEDDPRAGQDFDWRETAQAEPTDTLPIWERPEVVESARLAYQEAYESDYDAEDCIVAALRAAAATQEGEKA